MLTLPPRAKLFEFADKRAVSELMEGIWIRYLLNTIVINEVDNWCRTGLQQ